MEIFGFSFLFFVIPKKKFDLLSSGEKKGLVSPTITPSFWGATVLKGPGSPQPAFSIPLDRRL